MPIMKMSCFYKQSTKAAQIVSGKTAELLKMKGEAVTEKKKSRLSSRVLCNKFRSNPTNRGTNALFKNCTASRIVAVVSSSRKADEKRDLLPLKQSTTFSNIQSWVKNSNGNCFKLWNAWDFAWVFQVVMCQYSLRTYKAMRVLMHRSPAVQIAKTHWAYWNQKNSLHENNTAF